MEVGLLLPYYPKFVINMLQHLEANVTLVGTTAFKADVWQ